VKGGIMITDKLAIEKETVVSSIEEALTLSRTDYLVTKIGADLKEISLDENGHIAFRGTTYLITDWAFESLCRLLTIPKHFARSIPADLFLYNVNKLKESNNQRVIILISRDNVINIFSHPYVAAKNEDILTGLQSMTKRLDLDLNEVKLSDRGMEVSFLRKGLNVEPVPGDVTKCGIDILNSETGYRGAKACFFLLRLICSNGASLSDRWGKVNWSYDYRISYERSLHNFFKGIEHLQIAFNTFNSSYAELRYRELAICEYVNIWRRLARIVGNEMADRITGIDKDKRNYYNRQARDGDRHHSAGIILYDIYNSITEAAQRYPFVQRRNLESLGGSLVNLVTSGNA
jgi:hypothetical protein